VVFTQPDNKLPGGEAHFLLSGDITITLRVENTVGSAEFVQAVCVKNQNPACAFTLTDLTGKEIDELICIAPGDQVIADAVASLGGDLLYEFSVFPAGDAIIVNDPVYKATITFPVNGSYTVNLMVTNLMGESQCDPGKRICVGSPVLEAPANLRITDNKEKIALEWNMVTDPTAVGYNVYRADTAAGPFLKITDPALGSGVSQHTDLAVTVGQDYFYGVRAVYPGNAESGDSNIVSDTVAAIVTEGTFRRGDVDGNRTVELTDVVNLVGFLYLGEPVTLGCFDAADVDNTGVVELTDAIFELGWLYQGNPLDLPPPGPFTCGPDPADPADTLAPCQTACQ
jgi:hypothetical protein